jgi:hypothetical protein
LELNSKFLTDLADLAENETVFETEIDIDAFYDGKKIIVMGASHAGRIADVLDSMDLEVVDLTTPGWKITEQNVEKLSAQLQEVLAEDPERETILIYQLFDKSVYFNAGEDGVKQPPTKINGTYHIIGKLECTDKQLFRDIFRRAIPLFRAGGQCRKIILAPLIRYAAKPCCSETDNRKTETVTTVTQWFHSGFRKLVF